MASLSRKKAEVLWCRMAEAMDAAEMSGAVRKGAWSALLQGGGGHRADADAGTAFPAARRRREIGPHAPRAGKGQVVRLFLGFAGNVDGFIKECSSTGMRLPPTLSPGRDCSQPPGTAAPFPEDGRRHRGPRPNPPRGAAWAKVRKDAVPGQGLPGGLPDDGKLQPFRERRSIFSRFSRSKKQETPLALVRTIHLPAPSPRRDRSNSRGSGWMRAVSRGRSSPQGPQTVCQFGGKGRGSCQAHAHALRGREMPDSR